MKCIVKVANKANLSEKTKRQAICIMNDVTNNEISAGKDPMAIGATGLYVSCIKNGENIRQDDLSNAAGITGVTLRTGTRSKKQIQLNNTQQQISNRINYLLIIIFLSLLTKKIDIKPIKRLGRFEAILYLLAGDVVYLFR